MENNSTVKKKEAIKKTKYSLDLEPEIVQCLEMLAKHRGPNSTVFNILDRAVKSYIKNNIVNKEMETLVTW